MPRAFSVSYTHLDVYKRQAVDHPLYFLLHDEPNPEMTSFVFRETLMTHLLLWGNAYSCLLYTSRLWRQGQTAETVVVQHIITAGTIDEDIMKALASKDMTQNRLIAAVKARVTHGR